MMTERINYVQEFLDYNNMCDVKIEDFIFDVEDLRDRVTLTSEYFPEEEIDSLLKFFHCPFSISVDYDHDKPFTPPLVNLSFYISDWEVVFDTDE